MLKARKKVFDSEAPLFKQYKGQSNPQPAFLYLAAGEYWLDWDAEIGSVPMDVWHRRTLCWSVSPYLSKEACEELLEDEEVLELLDRVHNGHSVEWDGNNHVGALSDDASEASDMLRVLLDQKYNQDLEAHAQVWDALDWITAKGLNSLAAVWPSDEPFDAAVERLENQAASDGVVLSDSIESALITALKMEDPDDLKGEHLKAYMKYVR